MTRHELRVKTFKLLFRVEFNPMEEMNQQTDFFFQDEENMEIDGENRIFIENRMSSILDKLPEIDQLIGDHMTKWTPERIGKVELTIIRLAVFELLFDDEIPLKVAVDEAVELGKVYGQENAGGFINAVLSNIIKAKGLES